MPVIKRGTGSVILRGLSSFWTRLFKDSAVLDSLYSAQEVALGDIYLDLMETVLSKSIRNTPVFSKRDWKLLLLTNTDFSFDPPVYSSDSTLDLGPRVSVTAQELSSSYDGVVFELADTLNLTEEKRLLYPGYGIFNAGLVTGNFAHENLWVAVVPTGKTIFESVRALSRRVISNKRITSLVLLKVGGEDPTIVFKYGNEYSAEITLPAGTYSSVESIRAALQAAINTANASLTVPMNITTSIDGGYLIISSDKDLLVWESNSAFESQLFVKACRFKFSADVPPGREGDFYWTQTKQIQLLTSGYKAAGTEFRCPINSRYVGAKYIYNTLYDPSLVLEEARHYRISGGYIYFKSNPFEFERVAFRDFGDGRRQLALWLSDVSVDTLTLYYNYGYRFTKLTASSESYKNFIRGLYYYYTHGPQVERLRSAFCILAGIPVVENNDEMVLYVSPNKLTVQTSMNTYDLGVNTPATVEVGDILQAFDTLTDAFIVEDYVNNPHWYDKIVIPEFLMPKAPIGLRVSSVTTFIPNIGDTGFIIGDITTDSAELVTNNILRSTGDFSITTGAYFTVERDNSGNVFEIYIPPALTTGASSLDDMISYLNISLKQLIGNPVNGAKSSYELLTDARFSVVIEGVSYPVVVPASATTGVTSLAGISAVVQTQIDVSLGAGQIHVFPYADKNALVLLPATNTPFSLSDLNVSARSELGFIPFTSLSGAILTKVDNTIKFSSSTVGSSSRIKISDMNTSAIENFSMQPFRQGSGDYLGNDGDPTPGWEVMDKYLKYNTFRIKFDANAVKFSDETISIQEIVSSGRPKYTTAFVSPEFALRDSIAVHGEQVENVEAFLSTITNNDVLVADEKIHDKVTVNVSQPYAQYYRKNLTVDHKYETTVAKSEYIFSGVSVAGGSIQVRSKIDTVRYVDHNVELTDLAHLTPADGILFSNYGIYNRGILENGVSLATQAIPQGTIGGIYQRGSRTWVDGFELADLHQSVTHLLVIDSQMKAAGLDPFGLGIVKGHFMTFGNMNTSSYEHEFAVLNIYHNALMGGAPVDIIAFGNNVDSAAVEENFALSNMRVDSSISFRPGSEDKNNTWTIILPSTGTITQRLQQLMAVSGDNKDIFPFDVTFIPNGTDAGTWVPNASYYKGITHYGNPDHRSFFGHLYKVSWDGSSSHDDDEAKSLVAGGSLPHGFTQETRKVTAIRGGVNWGRETDVYDSTPIGALSRNPANLTHPYLLGPDGGGNNLYCDYDSAKLNSNTDIQYGEITFWKGIKYYFTNEAPTNKAEYYGANHTQAIGKPWPVGSTHTYRSYNWKGYWLAAFDMLGEYNSGDPNRCKIGGGSLPGVRAPADYKIHTSTTKWTLEIGRNLTQIQGTSLPSPITGNENDAYTVKLRSNTLPVSFDAPVESGHYRLEHQDWIYSDGSQWVRKRYTGSYMETLVESLANRVFNFVVPGTYDPDRYCSIIGAGYILCHAHTCNYTIWTDGSRWTKVIGGSKVGALTSGGYYDHLQPIKYYGYGPFRLDDFSQITDLAHTELSESFDWSNDSSLGSGPSHPLFRIVENGSEKFTVYVQVNEDDLESTGITFDKVPGVYISSDPDAIGVHYYDVLASNWATPTLAQLSGSNDIEDEFTLKVVRLTTDRTRLRLWNGIQAHHDFYAESGDMDQFVYEKHRRGKVLISIKLDYSGSYTKLTDYLQGIITDRSRIAVTFE